MRASVQFLLLNALPALARTPLDPHPHLAQHNVFGDSVFRCAVNAQPSDQPLAPTTHEPMRPPDSRLVKRVVRGEAPNELRDRPRRRQSWFRWFGRSPVVAGCIAIGFCVALHQRLHTPGAFLPVIRQHEEQAERIRESLDSLKHGQLNTAGKNALNERMRRHAVEAHLLDEQLGKLQALEWNEEPELRRLEEDLIRAVNTDRELSARLERMHHGSKWNKYLRERYSLQLPDAKMPSGVPTPSAKEQAEREEGDPEKRPAPAKPELAKRAIDAAPTLVPRV